MFTDRQDITGIFFVKQRNDNGFPGPGRFGGVAFLLFLDSAGSIF